MLLVHPVQEAVRFLPALLVVFLSGRSSDRSPWWDLGILAIIVVLGIMRWFTTRYRIWGGQIELRQGLVNRRLLTTPADRVRTVDVTAPIWHRALGLARVEIGTAGGGLGAHRIVLDALAAPVAAQLRGELLHRVATAVATADGPAEGLADVPANGPAGGPVDEPEEVLVRLDPAWVRYAPLTTSGLVSAAAIWGFSAQYIGQVDELHDRVEGAVDRVAALGVGVAALAGFLSALVAVSVLAVSGYVLTYWGFRLTRHTGGTLHISRGLITARATSLEERRIRGVEIGEPLGLRLAGAARLSAATSGLGQEGARSGSDWLTPPAPAEVVDRTAVAVVGDEVAVRGSLLSHGPAARRRRFTRAILPAAVLCAATLLLTRAIDDLPTALVVAGCLPLLASPWLAADRYAALGHALTPRHLIVRSGTFSRRRVVLARDGVIGVTIRESFFQRRAGLATVTATTAVGRQHYDAIDVPVELSTGLAADLLPGPFAELLDAGHVPQPSSSDRA
ncbi:MAG: PH domain-containing protein [Actinomycetales bacterium]|uniref:PH domain-containing protein n=1 Tax=Candidatus Phosphoribacter hodrii TaxID=2953743 RepID=A0A935CDW6_9MICO|nr:PH domain-containing protein [Candidatus Phosphoribacter hodrii]